MAQIKKVEDVMTLGCESIGEHESVADAAQKMSRLDIGALAICGDDDQLVGVITDRDIVTEVVCRGLDPARTEAGSIANGGVVTVRNDDELQTAIEIMSVRQVRRLPVVNEQEHPVGMISQADIATHADPAASGELLAAISEP